MEDQKETMEDSKSRSQRFGFFAVFSKLGGTDHSTANAVYVFGLSMSRDPIVSSVIKMSIFLIILSFPSLHSVVGVILLESINKT